MLCAAGTCGDGNGLTFASPGQTCLTLKTKYPTYSGSGQYYIQGLNFVFPTPNLVRDLLFRLQVCCVLLDTLALVS